MRLAQRAVDKLEKGIKSQAAIVKNNLRSNTPGGPTTRRSNVRTREEGRDARYNKSRRTQHLLQDKLTHAQKELDAAVKEVNSAIRAE